MLEIKGQCYKEVRCTDCRRLLALEYIFSGRLMIKCKCGETNIIRYKTTKNFMEKYEKKGGVE